MSEREDLETLEIAEISELLMLKKRERGEIGFRFGIEEMNFKVEEEVKMLLDQKGQFGQSTFKFEQREEK